jgi:hypothetical protein
VKLLHTPSSLAFLVPCLAAVVMAGCSSGAAPTASSASPGSSSAPGAAAAPTEELKKGLFGGVKLTETKSEVELRASKKKVAFTIDLPDGIKDFSERAEMKSFSKVKQDLADMKTYEGYSFQVMEGNPKWKEAGLETTLAELTKDGDFAKNKGKILDKGSDGDGFWFSSSIEEKDKKGLLTMRLVAKGDVLLQCRGNFEGTNVEKPEEVAETLVKVCKSLKISDG